MGPQNRKILTKFICSKSRSPPQDPVRRKNQGRQNLLESDLVRRPYETGKNSIPLRQPLQRQ